MGAFLRHNFSFIILYGSNFYGFNVWSIYSKLQTRPFRKFTFIYILDFICLIFPSECFVTIAIGIAQNPGLKALRRNPAWASFYLA